jgi:hypothetical protein
MNKLKAIFRILFPKKVQRKSKLILAHTFENGRTLWTYGENDFLNISSRYYSAIQTEMVHLEVLQQTKKQWQQAKMYGEKTCVDIMEQANDARQVIEYASQLKQLFVNFELAAKAIKSSQQELIEMMFCMFFLLDDEHEFGYNEAKNKEKLDLINTDPVAKELFFSQVQKILQGYIPLSDSITNQFIVTMEMFKRQHEGTKE